MSSKYYYLVASLPNLKFNDEPPMSTEDFLAECHKWLSPHDRRMLREAGIRYVPERCDGTHLLEDWKDFDGSLREELAAARRAKKKGEEGKKSPRVGQIMSSGTPLDVEMSLEKTRWDFLEEKGHGYFFDLNWLMVYYLQLKILERLADFDKDKGENVFYELCEVEHEKTIR
jgi:hypothetical protein